MNSPMASRTVQLPGVVLLFLLGCAPVFSQHLISAKAGNIQFLQGKVSLNGTAVRLKDGQTIQMENNQILTTGGGYAELLLAPFAILRLGENASLRMRENSLRDIQLDLVRGSALIEILEKLKTDPIRLHTSGTVIEMKKQGLYRLDAEAGRLRVYGGDALTIKGKKRVRVKNGRTVALEGELRPEKFDLNDADELHYWAARRSFALYARNLFLTNPGFSNPGFSTQLAWKSRENGLYNSYYQVTIPSNEDWNRYWQGVMSVIMRRATERTRRLRADPGPLPTPPPLIPVPPEEQQ